MDAVHRLITWDENTHETLHHLLLWHIHVVPDSSVYKSRLHGLLTVQGCRVSIIEVGGENISSLLLCHSISLLPPWLTYSMHDGLVGWELYYPTTFYPSVKGQENFRVHGSFSTFSVTERRQIQLKADRPHLHDYLTHRQMPWTDDDSSLFFAALGKAKQESSDRQTDRHTNGQTLPITLSPSLRGR